MLNKHICFIAVLGLRLNGVVRVEFYLVTVMVKFGKRKNSNKKSFISHCKICIRRSWGTYVWNSSRIDIENTIVYAYHKINEQLIN